MTLLTYLLRAVVRVSNKRGAIIVIDCLFIFSQPQIFGPKDPSASFYQCLCYYLGLFLQFALNIGKILWMAKRREKKHFSMSTKPNVYVRSRLRLLHARHSYFDTLVKIGLLNYQTSRQLLTQKNALENYEHLKSWNSNLEGYLS